MDLLQRFEDAGHNGRDVRPLAFWSWNDALDPEEIRRQVREMAKGGLGGHFMHARRGLVAPYLGPEWMTAVCAAVEEGRHTGTASWLYDEDCWPSGACSGRVYAGREAFRDKHLVFEPINPKTWEPSEQTVAVFVAKENGGGGYTDFCRVDDPHRVCHLEPAPGEVVLHFVYRFGAYVDVFSREATEEFLKRTYEVYRESLMRELGRRIPGIFTDEPQYGTGGHRVPWSAELRRFFERSCGYDVVDHLPALFFPEGNYRKVRFDFYESMTRLFLLAWTLPVFQWCDRNGLALTGHMMGEDTLRSQVECIGAAMPHYEYMHIPGIDHLGRRLGSPVLVKQVASVAAQLDRPRVLSEMFGGSGWNVSFDDLRWIAEWQFVLGVNRVCQHLSSFTLRGCRKRDYPPSLHYHQPWWSRYYLWNDYAARLLSVLTEGTAVADVLVVHPISSAWAEYSPLDHAAVDKLDERLRSLAETILAVHADFHFGDELILERHGRASKGTLVVGARRYGVVVVPDASNLRKSTVRLLGRFKRSGGRIVFAGRVPDHVDGEPSDEVERLARRCTRVNLRSLKGRAALRRALAPKLEVLTPGGKDVGAVLAQWRRVGKDHVFFFLNTDPDRTVKTRLRLPVAGTPVRLDPNTGEVHEVRSRRRGRRTTVSWTFGPRASVLFLVRPAGAKVNVRAEPPVPRRRKVLRGRWNLRRHDPNVLVLDTAQWRTDGGSYSDPMPIMDIQQELIRRNLEEAVVLRFEFNSRIPDATGRRFGLVLEQPEAWEMWYGGMRTPLSDNGPWWDSTLRRVDITPFVRGGVNLIDLRRPWSIKPTTRAALLNQSNGWETRTAYPEVELEAVYLVGDFGVAFPKGTERGPRGSRWMLGKPALVEEPDDTTGSRLERDGYPFYAGRMTLEKEVLLRGNPSPHAVLELPPFAAVTATVEVNGQEAGVVWTALPAGPWGRSRTVPVGALLRPGRNRLAITLTTSLRNALGPNHHRDGELYLVSPSSFLGSTGPGGRAMGPPSTFRADYNVMEFGLGGDVVLRY